MVVPVISQPIVLYNYTQQKTFKPSKFAKKLNPSKFAKNSYTSSIHCPHQPDFIWMQNFEKNFTSQIVSTRHTFCHHFLLNPVKNGKLFTPISQVSLRRVKNQYKCSKINFLQKKRDIPSGSPWCAVNKCLQNRPITHSSNPNPNPNTSLCTLIYIVLCTWRVVKSNNKIMVTDESICWH